MLNSKRNRSAKWFQKLPYNLLCYHFCNMQCCDSIHPCANVRPPGVHGLSHLAYCLLTGHFQRRCRPTAPWERPTGPGDHRPPQGTSWPPRGKTERPRGRADRPRVRADRPVAAGVPRDRRFVRVRLSLTVSVTPVMRWWKILARIRLGGGEPPYHGCCPGNKLTYPH